jgi:probable rRNA maturation factor
MSTEASGSQREDDGLLLFDRGTASLRRRPLKAFAEKLQRDVANGRPFACLLTRDQQLQRLNREFLQKDYATDVLSFPSGGRSGFLGEIAISIDRAREQAAEQGHTLDDEMKILMLHGVLHLLGMDHETDRGRMARSENRWRKQFELPAGLIERSRP